LRAAIARLAPQKHGTTDIYAIGVAGFSDLDVFTKEIDGAIAAIAHILPIRDRTVRLINHRETSTRLRSPAGATLPPPCTPSVS